MALGRVFAVRPHILGIVAGALGLAFVSPVGAVSAETGAAGDLGVTGPSEQEAAEPAPPPEPLETVELDRLLQLPSSMEFDRQTRNGVSADAWRARFRAALTEIRTAEEEVEATKRSLDEMAGQGGGGQWQMGPPGSSNTEVTPMSFKLREQLRKNREDLEAAQQKHRDLDIQADLAGVPEAWRQAD